MVEYLVPNQKVAGSIPVSCFEHLQHTSLKFLAVSIRDRLHTVRTPGMVLDKSLHAFIK